MSPFHHLFDFAQMLIFLAVTSRTLLSVSWYQVATCSTSSAVHAESRCALSFANSIHSFLAASWSSSVIAARFHPTTSSWSASSGVSTSTSHPMTSWSEPVAWFSASMVHFPIGQFAKVKSRTYLPSRTPLFQYWVAQSSFPISSPFLSVISSQMTASRGLMHLGSHRLLWALKSPESTVQPCRMIRCNLSFRAGLSRDCVSFWTYILTILVNISPLLRTSVMITSSLSPLLWSIRSCTSRPLPLHTAVQTLFLCLISYAVCLISNQFLSLGGSCKHTTSARRSTPVSSAAIVHSYDLAQLCWIAPIIGCRSSHWMPQLPFWSLQQSQSWSHLYPPLPSPFPQCRLPPYRPSAPLPRFLYPSPAGRRVLLI